jgi:hypothetical protein
VTTPLADRLAELERAVDAARAKREEAKDRRRHDAGTVPKQATAELVKFRDDIALRRPGAIPEADRPAKLQELSQRLLDFMGERGLVFEARGDRGGVLAVVDPSIGKDVKVADREVLAARRERDEFAKENADAIRAEVKAAEAATIREALAGDDPEAIREAITGPRAAALTTDDLGGTRERVTAAA